MANPLPVTITPEWAWQKVATNVITGSIHRLTSTVWYYQTYRLTGEAAPAAVVKGTIPEEAVKIFEQSNQVPISAVEPIDVYIMCQNSDDDTSDTGKIRVDLP